MKKKRSTRSIENQIIIKSSIEKSTLLLVNSVSCPFKKNEIVHVYRAREVMW
jgi:hypothetical protein